MSLNANHLVTLAAQRSWLGIPVAAVQVEIDAIIQTCINGASAMIESFLDRKLILNTVTRRYDGNVRRYLELGEWPIRSVISVHQSASWIFDATTLVAPVEYVIDSNETHISLKNRSFILGTQNVQVVFEHGYDSPSAPTTYPLSPLIHQAALMLTEWLYSQRTDRRLGVASKNKNGESINFIDGMPQVIADMLMPFKKDFFIPDTRAIPLR